MPGEFYIEDKKLKSDLTEIKNSITNIQNEVTEVTNNITTLITKSEGMPPVSGSVTNDWQVDEQDVLFIGAHSFKCKVQSLLISIHNLVGTSITVRLYMTVNGEERKVYEQSFDASVDPSGLWIVNGTVGIHEALRVTLQSNSEDDNGQMVDYDYMLEAM
ncbi:hypothetical protein VLL09_04845 [Dehalococcoides mccartyi]|uniref:Uncharacterized protein n=1 Tax=Dehalococcoides mccartyi TaxID=61435 RepID=A0AB38Z805_9CHLR|nr:hypothetical protein [Dehalococcoides mccartyi]WRO06720.1 hypothetical protein VLL09_04845 [Dehalococcoides mccartyi]